MPLVNNIIELSVKSIKNKIDFKSNFNSFEIFGYDFIFDQDLNPYLLEVNTNPGLDLDDTLSFVKDLIPRMMDDAFRLTIDIIYNTEYDFVNNNNNGNYNNNNKNQYNSLFELEGYSNQENLWEMLCNINEK